MSTNKNTTNFKQIKILKDRFPDEKYYQDLVSLILRFENSIHLRRSHYIKLDIRHLMDWITKEQFIRDILIKKGILKKGTSNFYFVNRKEEVLRKLSNDFLHYDQDNFTTIRSKSLDKSLNLEEMIEFSRLFYTVLKSVCISFENTMEEWEFDESIYYDGRKSFYTVESTKIKSYVGQKCEICNNGTIEYPDDNRYPYGPYLQCNNNKCKAILSTNLNLKKEKPNMSCIKIKCTGKTIKETFSFSKKEKYFECMSCGYKFGDDDKEIEIDLFDNTAYMFEED